jgi:hypothetical protein
MLGTERLRASARVLWMRRLKVLVQIAPSVVHFGGDRNPRAGPVERPWCARVAVAPAPRWKKGKANAQALRWVDRAAGAVLDRSDHRGIGNSGSRDYRHRDEESAGGIARHRRRGCPEG